MDPIEIVYINGLGHSGTTLLSLLLNSHSQMMSIGELKIFRNVVTNGNGKVNSGGQTLEGRRCSCGAPHPGACPFWQQVSHLLHQQQLPELGSLDLYPADTNEFRRINEAFYRALKQTANVRYLVDTSKDTKQMRRLQNETNLVVRPIFLRRRMEGVVYSNMRKGRPWLHTLRRSMVSLGHVNHMLADVDFLEVQYEDLTSAPEATLQRIWQWLDVPFEPRWQQWATQEFHLLAGNDMRLRPNPNITVDNQWQRELSSIQKLACRVGSALGNHRPLYRFVKQLRQTKQQIASASGLAARSP